MNHPTPLTSIVLVSLLAPAQAALDADAQHFVSIIRESLDIRSRYLDIVNQVIDRELSSHDGARAINRMARRMEAINADTDRALDQLSEEEKWGFKKIFEGPKLAPVLRKSSQSMAVVKSRLSQLNYFNNSSFRDACQRYDRACRRSYLGL